MSAGYVLGFVLALAITIWEWLAADESWGWYAVPLAIDSWYTYRLTIPWVLPLVAVHASDKATATTIAIIISVVGAIAVALFGERLLFGKRH
jgi:biotin transporter BioY